MKKNILTITLLILGALVFVTPTLATTTALLSPSSVSVNPGQSFNVSVSVNPQGVNNFAEKIELKYPADIIQVNSFTLNSQWIALTQPGYDAIDNINGILLKSAGYPGGFSSTTVFGTVSFSAKKEGNGIISIGDNSIAFEIDSQSVISGPPVSITITTPVVSIPKSEIVVSLVPETDQDIDPTLSMDDQSITPSAEQDISVVSANNSFIGTIGSIVTLGTGSAAVGILLIALAFMIGFYIIRPLVKKKMDK